MTRIELNNENTSAMRLILRIDSRRLSALIVGPETVDPTVEAIHDELPELSVKAIENVVYDHPLLLGDYAKIDIIFSIPELFIIPDSAADLVEEIADAMLPDRTGPRSILCEKVATQEIIGYAVNTDLINFLQRTFACATFHHSLAVTANWLSANSPAGFYSLVNGVDDMALCSFRADGTLRYLNRPQPAGPNDCAYFILATSEADEPVTLMTVDPDIRAAITDIITKVKPSAQLTAPALPERLLNLRHRAPGVAFDMLFITQL